MSTPKQTYGQILKSSATIGGSTVFNVVLGILRTKAMALLLGPSGMGLMGLYGSIADLAKTVAGMGINTSGVRQIAEAAATGDSERIARTITTLRRVALLLGVGGALLLLVFSSPISLLTFGDLQHTGAVALLGVVVLFSAVSGAQMALVQGMRRIADLACTNVWGGVYATTFSILIIYFSRNRERGIVAALICAAGMSIATSWWYSRKIKVERVRLRTAEVTAEVSALLKLGFVFMSSALMAMGAAYFVRMIVARRIGLEAAGFYQSAWTLGGLYIGIILQAMGADFFPRLTAVAHRNTECNRLVNEQAEVGLLLAGPGLIATLTFAPLFIELFYSARFGAAVEVLRWICLGMMVQVASWPMAFIMVAKGSRRPYFWCELTGMVAQVGLVWLGVDTFGLSGTGIAFFVGHVVYFVLVYIVVRALSGFRWSRGNKRLGLMYVSVITGIFLSWYWLPKMVTNLSGALLALIMGIHSLRRLCALVSIARLPRAGQRLLIFLRIAAN